jgi:dihydroneopterin aldolase
LYLLNIADCANVYGGEPIGQADLPRVSRVFSIPTVSHHLNIHACLILMHCILQPLASFDFDLAHHAIATITEDSVLTVWSTLDKYPLWQSKIPGDGAPSSLNFVDAGVVIGRKSGTSFQLLPALSDVVLSTIKFNNAGRDDPDMFGHITYDSRIQTLWVANSRRDSLVAFRIAFDMIAPISGEEEVLRGAYIDQVVEFVGPKPTIHFVILTADADPTGDEANAACIAAKLPPGDLALVAFSVHSSGVDQVLIKKEWYDSAFASATTKYPPYTPPQLNTQAPRQPTIAAAPQTLSQPIPSVPVRLRTPPSEEVEIEHAKEDSRDVKGKGAKGKNVGWKDRDESNKDKGKGPAGESSSPLTDSTLGVSLQKEIRKVEENLHTRIGRLIAKEMDKQRKIILDYRFMPDTDMFPLDQRLEEARANEQTAEFVRQEKILKLISNELTKNTTRVVEMAVKGEVQNSVLPSLENITKVEVKSAMNNQIAKGLSDSMKIVRKTSSSSCWYII